VCKHGKLTSGNQRATALSLAAKGSVVAEKRRTRCPFRRPFPHPWNALYDMNITISKLKELFSDEISRRYLSCIFLFLLI
jgi:hypothetical protein